MKNIQAVMKKISIFLGLFLIFLPQPAFAQENFGSIHIEQLDTDTKTPVCGVKLALYKIADKKENGAYEWNDEFKKIGIEIGVLWNNETYSQNIQMLDRYVEQNNISSGSEKLSDSDGQVTYDGIGDGIYFVKQINDEKDFEKLGYTYQTDSYIVLLPATDEKGNVTRTIYCKPKGKIEYPKEDQTIVVYKVWKDNNNKAGKRPANITVGLYCDNVLEEKVMLSVANNWTYQWKNLSKANSWSVKEIDIPEGYVSEITMEENTYTITNKLTPNEPSQSPPQSSSRTNVKTGDATNMTIYIMMLLVAAALLTGTWFYRKR